MHRRLHTILLGALLLTLSAGLAHADLGKLDPRARTALETARSQGGPGSPIAVEGSALNSANDLDVFIVGSVSRADLEAAGATIRTEVPGAGIFTAYIPEAAIEQVAALSGVTRIQGAAPVDMELNLSVPTTLAHLQRGAGPAFTGANGDNVIVGVVDSGIDYGHEDFDDALGNTRLLNIWDQTVAGTPPAGYSLGTEWSSAQIDANAATQTDTQQHGTHVMSIAAGDGSATGPGSAPAFTYTGVAPVADLIMVKTNFQTTAILDGVAYIFGRATTLGKNAVVNLSLGSHFGPHDGTSAFESGLNALTGPGRVIVKSAGNERGVAQHAEVFAAGLGTNATMTAAGSANNRIIAIDGYYEASEQVNVQITSPGGTVLGPYTLGTINGAYPGILTPNGWVYVENGAALTATGDKEVYIEIRGTSTASFNGTWTFTFIPVALGAANGEVDLWRFFQSTGSSGSFAIGNQATEELVSEPGNAEQVITVAAWTSKQNWIACTGTSTTFTGTPAPGNLAGFSSPGPTRDGRQKPDIAAPGLAIAAARSDDLAQACPASGPSTHLPGLRHVINAGTSMAAPHVTGIVALLMQKFGAVTPAFAKAHLSADALVDGFTGAVWNKDWGRGKARVDVTDPVAQVLSPNGAEVLLVGTNANITWNASDPIISGNPVLITIELSRSGLAGPFSETLASGIANSGSFNWFVTGPITTDAAVRITAVDPCTNQGLDVSDAEFTIANQPVPVALALFQAEAVEGAVKVAWKFTDDSDRADVAVERSVASEGPYELLATPVVEENGASVVVDGNVTAGSTYYYRLVATERTGEVTRFGPLSAVARGFSKFTMAPVWPNPTTGSTTIEFTVPAPARVRLAVFDVAGREVATIAEADFGAGKHRAEWDGRAKDGGAAAAGIYYVHLDAPGADRVVQRVVIAR
jgi:subtilisin family serine protease